MKWDIIVYSQIWPLIYLNSKGYIPDQIFFDTCNNINESIIEIYQDLTQHHSVEEFPSRRQTASLYYIAFTESLPQNKYRQIGNIHILTILSMMMIIINEDPIQAPQLVELY